MGTLRDYFTTDKDHGAKVTQTQEVTGRDGYKIPCQMFLDFGAGAITLAFYLGPVADPFQRCVDLITGNAYRLFRFARGPCVKSLSCGFPDSEIPHPVVKLVGQRIPLTLIYSIGQPQNRMFVGREFFQ